MTKPALPSASLAVKLARSKLASNPLGLPNTTFAPAFDWSLGRGICPNDQIVNAVAVDGQSHRAGRRRWSIEIQAASFVPLMVMVIVDACVPSADQGDGDDVGEGFWLTTLHFHPSPVSPQSWHSVIAIVDAV